MLRIIAMMLVFVFAPLSAGAEESNFVDRPISVVNFPDIGIEKSVELGVSIISKARVKVFSAIVLKDSDSDKPNPPGTTKIFSGILGLYKTNQDGKFYRDRKAVYVLFGQNILADDAGIFVPNDKSKPAVIYHYRIGGVFGMGKGYTFGSKPIIVPEESMEQEWLQDSFKSELVYSGISKNVITFLYREFINDHARPAFTQELKYDLGEGAIIGYKGARFEVIKATNMELQYKVIKHLE